jgi:hypothetical protein
MYSYRSSAPHLGSIFAVEVEVVQRTASHVRPAETLPIERYKTRSHGNETDKAAGQAVMSSYQHC